VRKQLFFILLVGFFSRIIGINFGLPLITHADEPIVVNHTIAYGGGDFNPHFFNIPPLISYVLFVVYGFYFIIGKLAGIFSTPQDFLEKFLLEPSSWYILGRFFIGVILGTITIYFLYLLANKLFQKRIALLSSLFLSLCFIHILHSHYIYVDIPLTFAILLVGIFSLKLYSHPTFRNYVLCGLLVGLSCAIKYNGILSAVFVIFAHFLSRERKNITKPIISIIFCVIAFFIFNPFAFIDFSFFNKEILEQAHAEGFTGWWYHFRFSLAEGIGWPMLIFGILGSVISLGKEKKENIILLSFPLFFFFSLGVFSQHHERYVLPIVPFVCIYAAYFIYKVKKKNRGISHLILILYPLLLILVLVPNIIKVLWLDYIALQKDTRLLAKEWIEENIAPGSKIALGHSFFCPKLWPTKEQLREKIKEAKTVGQKIKLRAFLSSKNYPRKNYNLYFLGDREKKPSQYLFSLPLIESTPEALKKEGIEYILFHTDICGKEKKFFNKLKSDIQLIKEFSPYFNKNKKCAKEKNIQTALPFFTNELFSRSRAGYPIWIYKLKD
jgi:4-amino-4-deoxy-L-arabinose transferase-like glycosyltransferase